MEDLVRYRADIRTLVWTLLAPALVSVQFARPDWIVFLCWFSCYLALAFGVIAHNHNHCPTFRSRACNDVFANWLSIFYGYPIFAWIPTHNVNHHRFVNRPGDKTIPWRHGNQHNAMHAATYFFVSSYHQSGLIREFIGQARSRNHGLSRRILVQYVVWLGTNAAALALAAGLHGWRSGLLVWLFALGLPALFSLWMIMFLNYEQHVHTDAWSNYNHSRNFTGAVLNFLLFNNGYHAAHHRQPGLHWSRLREAHARIEASINPDLIQRNVLSYLFRQYVLAPFNLNRGTRQIGGLPYDPCMSRRGEEAEAS